MQLFFATVLGNRLLPLLDIRMKVGKWKGAKFREFYDTTLQITQWFSTWWSWEKRIYRTFRKRPSRGANWDINLNNCWGSLWKSDSFEYLKPRFSTPPPPPQHKPARKPLIPALSRGWKQEDLKSKVIGYLVTLMASLDSDTVSEETTLPK